MLSGGTKGLSEVNYGAGGLTEGDIAILRFVAAAELLETDLWSGYGAARFFGNAKTGAASLN
jgi:hypothetical protein